MLIVHLLVVHLSLRGVIVVMIEVVEAIGVGMVHPCERDVVSCEGGQEFISGQVRATTLPKVHLHQGD
jgi:hypothetical protein